jgi:hypothetical protein
MYYALLACAAGPNSTGQQMMTHLFLHILPIIIFYPACIAIAREQALLHTLVATVQKMMAWCLQGRACRVCKKRVKRYKKPVRNDQESNKTMSKERSYLLPFLFNPFNWLLCGIVPLTLLATLWQEPMTPSSSRLNNGARTTTTSPL